jgi:hypothetical protein
MARPMYALLTSSPFWLLTDPGPLAIYDPPPMPVVNSQGAHVLNAAGQPRFVAQPTIGRAERATIDARFSRARKYWLSYMNIRGAVYNALNDNINNAFKVLNDPNLIGWNPAMELQEIFDQIMATYGWPTPAALLLNDTLFKSVYSLQDAPKVLFLMSKIVKKSKSLEKTHTHHSSSLTMLCTSSYNVACTPVTLMIGIKSSPPKRSGPTSRPSSRNVTRID